MSNFYFYLKVKPFIGQWLVNHYGNPVVFPSRSAENACIRRFVSLRPKNWQPTKREAGTVAVAIPDTGRKRVISYNYMSKHAREALEEIIDDTFKMQMWKDLNEMTRCGCTLLKSVRALYAENAISAHAGLIPQAWGRLKEEVIGSRKLFSKKMQEFLYVIRSYLFGGERLIETK